MATVNIRALWGGALDSDSDSESDASILGELKDDAVYEYDSDYDFDRLPQKSEMNPAKLNMEYDLVSIGSSSDDEFHVPTTQDYRRTRDFEESDAVSYDSDSSYEVLAEKKSFPKMAGLRGDEFENYIGTDEYDGTEQDIAMNDADADLVEIEGEGSESEGLKKLAEELKSLPKTDKKTPKLPKEDYKATVEEALERAMAGISGAVEGRRTKEKLRKAVGKLRGNAKSSKKAREEEQLKETLEVLEEDEADDEEDGGYRTPTAEELASEEKRGLAKDSEEQETILDDIEEDAFDDSVSRAGSDPLSVYSIEGKPLPPLLKKEVKRLFADPKVVSNYKAIVRQVGSKKGDILRFLQQNDEWIAEADTNKSWTKQLLESELKMFIADRLESGKEVIFEGRIRGIDESVIKNPAVQKEYKELRKAGYTTKDKKTAFIQSQGIPFTPRGLSLEEVDKEFQKAIALKQQKSMSGGGSK